MENLFHVTQKENEKEKNIVEYIQEIISKQKKKIHAENG